MARLKDTEINGNLVVKGDLLNKDGVDLTTAFSNPNLLINSDFRNPINQRGQTIYEGSTSGGVYTIDRWILDTSSNLRTVEVLDGYIRLTNNHATYNTTFRQQFKNALPSDNSYTLTVKVKSLSGTMTARVGSTTKELAVGMNYITIENQIVDYVYIGMYTNSSCDIEYIKLEQGSIATPLVPRPYAEDVTLVEYFTRTYKGALGIAHISSTTIAFVTIACDMRTLPTINEANVSLHCCGANYDGTTKMVNVNSDDNTIAIQINGTFSSSIVGQSAFVFMNNDTLILDAEIY